ncbi:MAG: hypothetical protein IJQ10_03095 [Clostridia bacterium]|nr:hypothetical protein [Clostridia bacterium]
MGTLEVVHSIIGAATNSKLGKYSIGRAIKNSMVDKAALRGKMLNIVNSFQSIFGIGNEFFSKYSELGKDLYQKKFKEAFIKGEKNIDGFSLEEEATQEAKQKAAKFLLNDGKIKDALSRVKVDVYPESIKTEESKEQYKIELLKSISDLKEMLDELGNKEETKELTEVKIEYTANSIVITGEGSKETFTMNSDGSLTYENCNNDTKKNQKFTLMPPESK